MPLVEFAAAKINLTLHVTGQRADGYHLLDSLVVFADVGDSLRVRARPGPSSLRVDGPEAAAVPCDASNSVLKIAPTGHAFVLTKHLPTSAGIGGGTADAAAAFRATRPGCYDVTQLSASELSDRVQQAAPHGADVPVCLFSKAARMRGIGDELSFPDRLPVLPAVLVNPRVAVSTPRIFNALECKTNPAMPDIPRLDTVSQVSDWLRGQRNDLQGPAMSLVPEIVDVLAALEQSAGCLLARMSGSGATCFGLYGSADAAQAAAARIAEQHTQWWVRDTHLAG